MRYESAIAPSVPKGRRRDGRGMDGQKVAVEPYNTELPVVSVFVAAFYRSRRGSRCKLTKIFLHHISLNGFSFSIPIQYPRPFWV